MNFGTQNPWLPKMGQAITSQVTDNLQQNILPSIRSGAQSVGGFGGSRQGIAEGRAISGTNQALSNSLAGMYGNAYGQDQNFFTAQRGQDLQQQQVGANLFGQGMMGLGQQGQGTYNAGLNQFNAGALPYQTFAGMLSPFTGLNSSQQTNLPGPSTGGSLLGGLLGGLQLYNLWGG
jgi:hypothetical protein